MCKPPRYSLDFTLPLLKDGIHLHSSTQPGHLEIYVRWLADYLHTAEIPLSFTQANWLKSFRGSPEELISCCSEWYVFEKHWLEGIDNHIRQNNSFQKFKDYFEPFWRDINAECSRADELWSIDEYLNISEDDYNDRIVEFKQLGDCIFEFQFPDIPFRSLLCNAVSKVSSQAMRYILIDRFFRNFTRIIIKQEYPGNFLSRLKYSKHELENKTDPSMKDSVFINLKSPTFLKNGVWPLLYIIGELNTSSQLPHENDRVLILIPLVETYECRHFDLLKVCMLVKETNHILNYSAFYMPNELAKIFDSKGQQYLALEGTVSNASIFLDKLADFQLRRSLEDFGVELLEFSSEMENLWFSQNTLPKLFAQTREAEALCFLLFAESDSAEVMQKCAEDLVKIDPDYAKENYVEPYFKR
jgi:hypothetical protein